MKIAGLHYLTKSDAETKDINSLKFSPLNAQILDRFEQRLFTFLALLDAVAGEIFLVCRDSGVPGLSRGGELKTLCIPILSLRLCVKPIALGFAGSGALVWCATDRAEPLTQLRLTAFAKAMAPTLRNPLPKERSFLVFYFRHAELVSASYFSPSLRIKILKRVQDDGVVKPLRSLRLGVNQKSYFAFANIGAK